VLDNTPHSCPSILARHRGVCLRRSPHDDQAFFDLVGRFVGGQAGRSG
jgi:hypothetical protein